MKVKPKRWSEREKHYLRSQCGTDPIEDIAIHLNRSYWSTRSMAHRLGLSIVCEETKRRKIKSRGVEMLRILNDHGYGSDVIKQFVDQAHTMTAGGIEKILQYKSQAYEGDKSCR